LTHIFSQMVKKVIGGLKVQ